MSRNELLKKFRPPSHTENKKLQAPVEFHIRGDDQSKTCTVGSEDTQPLASHPQNFNKLHIPKPPKDHQKPIMAFTVKSQAADEVRNAVQGVKLDPESQTLDYTGFEGIRFDDKGNIVPHSILGSLQDFRSYLEAKGETELVKRIPTSQRDPGRYQSEAVEKEMCGLNSGYRNIQSNALQNWHTHMTERRRQQDFLSDLLDRPVGNLLMNQANSFRESQEQRELLNQVMPLIHSGYGYRVASEFWSVPQRYGDEMTGITATLTRTEQGRREPVTHVGQPRTIRQESGILCAETLRPTSRTWNQSAYLQHRLQELKEVLRDMDIKKPDIDGLEVISSNKPSTFVTVRCSPLLEKEEEKEHKEMKKETLDPVTQHDNVQSDALLFPALRFCGQLARWTGNSSTNQGQVGINARVFFEALTGEKASSDLDLHNEGSTAIFYAWQQLLMPCSFPNLQSRTKTPCFYFLSSSGVILPGETQQIEFIFKSREPGIKTELWQLNTHPLLMQGASMQVTLRGVAMCQDKKPFTEMKLEKRATVELCKSIVFEMVKEIHTPERPSSPAEFYVTEEQEFLRKNPKLQYHNQPVEDLKRLWQEVNPGRPWDYSVDTLRQVVLSLPEESAQEKHLAQLNSLFLQLSEPSEMKVQKSHLTATAIGQLLWRKLLDDMVVEAMRLRYLLGLPKADTWIKEEEENSQTSDADMVDSNDEKRETKGGAANKESKSEVEVRGNKDNGKSGKRRDVGQELTSLTDNPPEVMDTYTRFLHRKVYALMEDLVDNLCDLTSELNKGDEQNIHKLY